MFKMTLCLTSLHNSPFIFIFPINTDVSNEEIGNCFFPHNGRSVYVCLCLFVISPTERLHLKAKSAVNTHRTC